MVLNRSVSRLLGGVALTGILVSATIGSATLLAEGERSAPRLAGGFQQSTYVATRGLGSLYGKVGDAQLIQNWDCGCPPLTSRIKQSILKTELKGFATSKKMMRQRLAAYPTRCLWENHSDKMKKRDWQPINNYGDSWPPWEYPKGFPEDAKLFPKPNTADKIPFPGWPHAYIEESGREQWENHDRKKYHTAYAKAKPAEKTPGKVAGNPPENKKGMIDGWVDWQVHHIMERRFGGENNWGNLVPMWSGRGTKKRPNKHSQYTNWWHRVTLDYDVMQRDASDGDTCALCGRGKDPHKGHSFMTIKQMQDGLAKCRKDLR